MGFNLLKKRNEGKEKPAEGKEKTAEGKEKPAEGEVKPVEGKEKPAEGEGKPAKAKKSTNMIKKKCIEIVLIIGALALGVVSEGKSKTPFIGVACIDSYNLDKSNGVPLLTKVIDEKTGEVKLTTSMMLENDSLVLIDRNMDNSVNKGTIPVVTLDEYSNLIRGWVDKEYIKGYNYFEKNDLEKKPYYIFKALLDTKLEMNDGNSISILQGQQIFSISSGNDALFLSGNNLYKGPVDINDFESLSVLPILSTDGNTNFIDVEEQEPEVIKENNKRYIKCEEGEKKYILRQPDEKADKEPFFVKRGDVVEIIDEHKRDWGAKWANISFKTNIKDENGVEKEQIVSGWIQDKFLSIEAVGTKETDESCIEKVIKYMDGESNLYGNWDGEEIGE